MVKLTRKIKKADLSTWDAVESVGGELAGEYLAAYLTLGALADAAVPYRKKGRPKKGETDAVSVTISTLARSIGCDRTMLSNAANDAEFWEGHLDQIPPGTSAEDLAVARNRIGWKPGMRVLVRDRKAALKILRQKSEGKPLPPPSQVELLKGARAKVRKALKHEKPELGKDDLVTVEGVGDRLNAVVAGYEDGE